MRIAHLADLHFREASFDEARKSIQTVIDDHKREPFDLIAIAGDTWDGPTQNSARAKFASFVDLIRGLANCAPVAMIYGTPSHDSDGSLEVFEQIESRYGVTILRPGKKYFLCRDFIVQRDNQIDDDRAVLFGVPEPNKKWLLANQEATGKDNADLAAQHSMRALLLGLGGMRKQHSDLPCVLLYHGQVRGAKTGTGFEADGGLAVTLDDLACVGADYIALGDIHEPQQIPGIPAYYPGSIYPLNWGECHKAGCNVVELMPYDGVEGNDSLFDVPAGIALNIERLDFPHPQRVKISSRYVGEDFITLQKNSFADVLGHGVLVWWDITATREESADIDVDACLDELMRFGALPGSRVTLNILPTETVRAGEITEKRSLRDKVQVWSENSDIDLAESVLAKADEIEREAAARGAAVSGAHIRINRLVLRGAKGLWQKQQKDEIDLDLDCYDAGVIAIVGVNGAGKTTIIENLHPWPGMLTRSGALKDHFRLKDSCRDLYFTDDRTGQRYRALITIRADIASGAAEYYLYRDNGGNWEPLPGINGRKEPYEEAVNTLFGSLPLYLRTAFQTQRPTKDAPDLAETTKGERKTLFAELSGIDYLDVYRTDAKSRADAIDNELVASRAVIDAANGLEASAGAVDSEIKIEEERAKHLAVELNILEGDGKAAKVSVETGRRCVESLVEKKRAWQAADAEVKRLEREIESVQKSRRDYEAAASGRDEAAKEIERIEALEKELDELRAERTEGEKEYRAALEEHQKKVREIGQRGAEIQNRIDSATFGASGTERELAVLQDRIAALESEPIKDTCPTCKQRLPEAELEALKASRGKALAELKERAALLSKRHEEGKAQAEAARKELAGLVAPEAPVAPVYANDARLVEIEEELSLCDVDAAREELKRADIAQSQLVSLAERMSSLTVSLDKARTDAKKAAYSDDVLNTLMETLKAEEERYEALQARYVEIREDRARAVAFAQKARQTLADIDARIAERKKAESAVSGKEDTAREWRLLERACGPDGIQALELDALAPSIADVTNRLLAAQNPRYSVEFRTTRIAGKGSKTKQIETFEIFVLDRERGTEQEIGTLSGGEGVWIKRAVYDAFAAIRARNTDVQFRTVMQDETDGALDPEARMAYLRMLEKAHQESGRHHTLLITHSTEIQAMVNQTIDVTELDARQGEEEACKSA